MIWLIMGLRIIIQNLNDMVNNGIKEHIVRKTETLTIREKNITNEQIHYIRPSPGVNERLTVQ
jgi:hypothetical protein